MSLNHAEAFTDFFKALYGNNWDPFPWQIRLSQKVLEGKWPSVIALPTASGKTACIDIAVYALACQAELPTRNRTAPRRIFFVVDRRVIVDEAFERAKLLTDKLCTEKSGIVRTVADRLRMLACGDEPLACFQLRGGIYRDDSWAKTPVQPTVIASTVDQIGSRLLFRGYGLRSGYLRPIHAGLAANDSLILLDEAHCAIPFKETMEAISIYRQWAEEPIENPFSFVMMTATPPGETDESQILRADKADWEHQVLGKRFKAAKPTNLIVAKKAKGDNAAVEFAEEATRQALALVKQHGHGAVGIIVNRVAVAKLIHEKLSGVKDHDAVLLIGRMRSLDRDEVVANWLDKLRAQKSGTRVLDRPVIVVATQCLEVGANLDFDGMVCECASLDALRQRFGRLNRMGRDIDARGIIVIRADQTSIKTEDPIYGGALSATWNWLSTNSDNAEVDMGINSLGQILTTALDRNKGLIEILQQPTTHAPVMVPTHLDFFSQSSPVPSPDPDPSVFLHGPARGVAELQVLWRADIDHTSESLENWVDALSLCPPTSGEYMVVTIQTVRRWLSTQRDQAHKVDEELSDVIVGKESEDNGNTESKEPFRLIRWNGPQQSEFVTDPKDILPGDTLVIPAAMGGWEYLGHVPDAYSNINAIDKGDEAQLRGKSKCVLRLHSSLKGTWPDSAARDSLYEIAQEEDLPEDLEQLRTWLFEAASLSDCPGWLRTVTSELAADRKLKLFKHPFGGLVLHGSRILNPLGERRNFTDEDDSSSATVQVGLEVHCEGVSRFAKTYAEACGLSSQLVEDLKLAGLYHDIGKADHRFQLWLQGGDKWSAASSQLLAKSGRMPKSLHELIAARRKSGYPRGGRHELLSVRLLESSNELMSGAVDKELLLYLVASHHGRCRPFAPVINDDNPVPINFNFKGTELTAASDTKLERLDSGVPDRFWKLVRRYGWWGLTYLEAILRLADHRRSEEEQVTMRVNHV